MAVKDGEFVAEYIEPRGDRKYYSVQPNGVDLSIGSIQEMASKAKISNDDYTKPERKEVEARDGIYYLESGKAYTVVYGEKITIPEEHIGFVEPRSRLMRCGVSLDSAVWDAGYEGIGEGALYPSVDCRLSEDLRVGQMVFFETVELDDYYDGSHQNERL